MCGIAGTIGHFRKSIEEIQNRLTHRGPDAKTYYSYNGVNLIHTRLAIQDIKNGSQPFLFGDYAIVFNGEIYNHFLLRERYLKEYRFKTRSDTETLLYLYIKYKNDMFEMLDGMFAFAILNKRDNTLILSRDRAGKKPLYLYQENQQLLFASELNVIKATIEKLAINEESIQAYLRCGFFYKDNTPYHKVCLLEPGCVYEIDISSLHVKKSSYFNIEKIYQEKFIGTFNDASEQLDRIIHQSIKDRLLASDVEVGAFLSGGIDSSLIVAIASHYTQKLKTFTVKFEGTYDESSLACMTANQYMTYHQEITINVDLKNDIEHILQSYGEPFMDSSAIPSYYVAREAKRYVNVVLNGDGADELFAGYRRYVPIANSWVSKISYIAFLRYFLPLAHKKQSIYNYFYRLLSLSSKKGIDFYLSATTDIFEDFYSFPNNSIMQNMSEDIELVEHQNMTPLSKMLLMDFKIILHSDLLKKMDIATMQHGLEARSPFLSKGVLEFAPTLQDRTKINGTTTKYILRHLAKKYLSKKLIHQPKRGFEVPLKQWVEKDLKEPIFELLSHGSYSANFISQDFITSLLLKKINVSDEKRAKMLWTMYALDVWKKQQ